MRILRTLPFVMVAPLVVWASAAGASSRFLLVMSLFCLPIAWLISLIGYAEPLTRWGVYEIPERPKFQKRRRVIVGLSLAITFSTAALQWPLRACFWAARPALERIAQQVQRGVDIVPQSIGPLRIEAGKSHGGQVALWLDDNVLVREVPGKTPQWSRQSATNLDGSWTLYHEM